MMLHRGCPDGQPRSPGVQTENLKVCVMTFIRFERALDQIAPTVLLAIGLLTAFAFAGLGA